MGIYLEAIKRPFSNIYKLILGSLLNILPIINFFSLGYVYESAKSALKGKKDLPNFEEIVEQVKGLLAQTTKKARTIRTIAKMYSLVKQWKSPAPPITSRFIQEQPQLAET